MANDVFFCKGPDVLTILIKKEENNIPRLPNTVIEIKYPSKENC